MTMIAAKTVPVMNSADALIVEALVELFATQKCVAIGLGILTESKAIEKEIEATTPAVQRRGWKGLKADKAAECEKNTYRDC
jgi:hypothetical protein